METTGVGEGDGVAVGERVCALIVEEKKIARTVMPNFQIKLLLRILPPEL